MSKKYLVYYGTKPMGGIDAVDSVAALRIAKSRATPDYRKKVRVRLAEKGLLNSLANQRTFNG